MITADEMSMLHTVIAGSGDRHFEEILDQMFAIVFEIDDLMDEYQAHEEIVDAANRARDVADRALDNQQSDAAEARGCDLYHSRKEDGI